MKRKLNRILLIDDDEVTNFLHQRVLQTACADQTIEVAETVKEALQIMQLAPNPGTTRPDLIFLDLNMPGLSGWDFLDAYQLHQDAHPEPSVLVILSASANPDDEQRAQALKAVSEFRRKPLSSQMVREIMEKYFEE